MENDCQESSLIQVCTNDVLVEEGKNKIFYYLPCYVRFKVKTVKEFQIEKFSGVVSATLLFGFYHGNLPENILEQFTGQGNKSVILQLPRQQSIELRESNEITLKQDNNSKIMDYVIRTEFDCNLAGDVFFTPFEIFNLYLTITVQTIVLDPKLNDGKTVHIKFNCMDTTKAFPIDSGSDCEYGTYTLAKYFLDSDYTNTANHRFSPISVTEPQKRIQEKEPKKKKKEPEKEKKQIQESLFKTVEHQSNVKMMNLQADTMIGQPPKKISVKGNCDYSEKPEKEKKIKNYQYTHFRIPLYKYPVSSLVQIFIPVWVLAAINLGIYFQDSNVIADKIASVATVTLAFVAFIPTINERIPQTSMVKMVEMMIYLQIGATFLTLMDALAVRKNSPLTYETVWYRNGFFLLTLLINLVCVFIVATMLILHKFWWQKVYLREKEDRKSGKLNRDIWQNKQCDEEFKKMIISNKITVIAPEFQKVKIGSDRTEHFT